MPKDVEGADSGGSDRALAVFGATRIIPPGRPGLVVMCGTAITVERITAEGVWQGGAIAPGLGQTARALNLMTAQLPFIELSQTPPAWGRGTVNSLKAGIFWGIVGAVRELLRPAGSRPGPRSLGRLDRRRRGAARAPDLRRRGPDRAEPHPLGHCRSRFRGRPRQPARLTFPTRTLRLGSGPQHLRVIIFPRDADLEPIRPGQMAGREPPRGRGRLRCGRSASSPRPMANGFPHEPVPAIQAISTPIRGPGDPPDAFDPPCRRPGTGKRRCQAPVSQPDRPGTAFHLDACTGTRHEREVRSRGLNAGTASLARLLREPGPLTNMHPRSGSKSP